MCVGTTVITCVICMSDCDCKQALVALRLYKAMAREAEQDDLEVDVASAIMCYAE